MLANSLNFGFSMNDRYESVMNKEESSRLDVPGSRALVERANEARGGGGGGGGQSNGGHDRKMNKLARSLRKLFAARDDDEVRLTLGEAVGGRKWDFAKIAQP
jgi:hypothetical protein